MNIPRETVDYGHRARPEVGYDRAAEISKHAYKTGKTIREVAREETDLSEEELDGLLNARKMMKV